MNNPTHLLREASADMFAIGRFEVTRALGHAIGAGDITDAEAYQMFRLVGMSDTQRATAMATVRGMLAAREWPA
jgi:hypothetical protein